MEENKRSVQEIRQEIADILGIPVNDNIESVYEHSLQYQLDDHDVDRIADLRRELSEAIESESSQNTEKHENTTTTVKRDSRLEKLENRISAYESGSTPEKEAELDELREKIISILDQHGVKDNNGNLKVIENEGGVVELQFESQVTEMRNRIREIAAQRTGKLSQKGEDVLPILKSLQDFLKTPEGKKEGAYESEIARLIEENEKRLKSIEAFQKDAARVQELKAEIEELNKEIAEIEAEFAKKPNYDAESIERTEKRVSLYHKQNELTGILTRNPKVNENIDTSRVTERIGNILGELKAIQQEKDIGQKGQPVNLAESKNGNDVKNPESKDDGKNPEGKDDGKNPEGKDDGKNPEGKDDGKNPEGKDDGKNPEGKDDVKNPEGKDDGKNPEGKDDEKNPEGKDDEKNPEGNGKQTGEGQDNPQPTYKVGRIRGALLSFIQKLLGKVKPDGFLGKFLGGVESTLLIGAKPEIPMKLTTVPEKSKGSKQQIHEEDPKKSNNKPNKSEEKKVEELDRSEEKAMMLSDSQWVKDHIIDGSKSSLDEQDLRYKLIKRSMKSLVRDVEGKRDEELQKMVVDREIPEVIHGEENAYNNMLYHKIADIILENAEQKGVDLNDKSGEARPIGDIYADLEKLYFTKRTNDVSKRSAEGKNEGEKPGKQTGEHQTEK